MPLPSWTEWATSGRWLSPAGRALPLMPGPLGDALSLVNDPDVDARQLLRLVSREQTLAARVLRMANVAACAPMREVTSIDQAVVRLGTQAVQRAVLAACFASWAQPNNVYGHSGLAQIQHGIGTAGFARLVAMEIGEDPDEAFAHGLLHDIGKLFLLKLHTEFIRSGGTAPTREEVDTVVTEHHAEVGGMAMQHWGLPEALREPVRWHHQPTQAPHCPRASAVTYTANMLAHHYGLGCEATPNETMAEDPVCLGLGLDAAAFARFAEQAPVIVETTAQLQ